MRLRTIAPHARSIPTCMLGENVGKETEQEGDEGGLNKKR